MLDEFDEATWRSPAKPPASRAEHKPDPIPRLVSRIYAASDATLRARVLQCLLDPLGTLGLAAVAAGAFAVFLQRRGAEGLRVSIEDAGRYSGDQITELVRFVEQVSPESLQAVVGTFSDSPVGITAFSAAAIVLLLRTLRRTGRATHSPSSSAEQSPPRGV